MKKKKAVIVGGIILILMLMRMYSMITAREDKQKKGEKKTELAVDIAPVSRTTVREIGKFTGSLIPYSKFIVAPKIAGRLEKLTVDIGDPVKSGDLIAELDDGEYIQQVEQAKAELAVAKANVIECKSSLVVSSRELGRVQTLRETKVASESDLDEATARFAASEAKHAVALAEVTRREAALKAAEVRLSYTRIRASWENKDVVRTVGERFVDAGEMLTPNAPIVSILDNHIVIALIDIIERDYSKVKPGLKAVIMTDAYSDREFAGVISRIAPVLKESSRQARVEIEISNPDGILKPGMFIRANIEYSRHENTIVVPFSSLAKREGKTGVFLADTSAMKALFIPVACGIIEGD
ncbi:MAG: efflux RND transporter periplasmic adaptor subunit, partial [Candidatus Aureabacteria bacterium]|nr:efflux RND transporter periplasmic adaptor subunit [Candidatus Auribacterota bacterium]